MHLFGQGPTSIGGVEGVRGVSGVGISQLPVQIRRSLHEEMMMLVRVLVMESMMMKVMVVG